MDRNWNGSGEIGRLRSHLNIALSLEDSRKLIDFAYINMTLVGGSDCLSFVRGLLACTRKLAYCCPTYTKDRNYNNILEPNNTSLYHSNHIICPPLTVDCFQPIG